MRPTKVAVTNEEVKNYFSSKLVQLAIVMIAMPLLGELSASLDTIPYLVTHPEVLKFSIAAIGVVIAWLRSMTVAPVDTVSNSVKRLVKKGK